MSQQEEKNQYCLDCGIHEADKYRGTPVDDKGRCNNCWLKYCSIYHDWGFSRGYDECYEWHKVQKAKGLREPLDVIE